MKITIDISEDEILSLQGCIHTSEAEGYDNKEAQDALDKIRVAFKNAQSVVPPLVDFLANPEDYPPTRR